MNIMYDTSVFVAALVQSHPKHGQCFEWMKKTLSSKTKLLVCTHSLAECYAVLTKLPLSPRISPSEARYVIKENIEKKTKLVSLSAKEYGAVIEHCATLGFSGGLVYDGLILAAAKKAKVKKLFTLNPRHFTRLISGSDIDIIS